MVTFHHLPIIALTLSMLGCATSEFVTLPIYETPSMYVRLEIDRSFGTSHSHPATLSGDQISWALSGIIIEEPIARLPILNDMSQPRRHPAFTEKETGMLAPLLSAALAKATSEEIVAFYESHPPTGIHRQVTSGGLFIHDDELHVILANYRSPTHHMADPGVADTTDDRLTPMRPLAPQRGSLDFEPNTALHKPDISTFGKLFHWDRRELIILLAQMPASSLRNASK